MTEARLVTVEQLAAALRKIGPDGRMAEVTESAALIFAALPAAAPAEGLREALALLRKWHRWATLTWKPTDRTWDSLLEDTRAALARHESAGSE